MSHRHNELNRDSDCLEYARFVGLLSTAGVPDGQLGASLFDCPCGQLIATTEVKEGYPRMFLWEFFKPTVIRPAAEPDRMDARKANQEEPAEEPAGVS